MTREEAIYLRLTAQSLIAPQAQKPEDVVSRMGAMQAQDSTHFKWAIGMRTANPGIESVKAAVSSGKILRLHLLRCTVQAVTPHDLSWMTTLCMEKNLRTIRSWASYTQCTLSESYIQEASEALKEFLANGKSMEKTAILQSLQALHLPADTAHINQLLLRGEIEGLLCSGELRGNTNTWALVSDRIRCLSQSSNSDDYRSVSPEEALGILARKYFRSHSPATFEDFCWWTGLNKSENRKAIEKIAAELEENEVDGKPMFIHHETAALTGNRYITTTSPAATPSSPLRDNLHLLPAYDEYLIGYKSRWVAIDKKHEPKAYNNFGVFKPVILHEGRVTGNWKTSFSLGAEQVEADIFTNKRAVSRRKLKDAILNLQNFCRR